MHKKHLRTSDQTLKLCYIADVPQLEVLYTQLMYHTCGWPKYSHYSNRNSPSKTTELAINNSTI